MGHRNARLTVHNRCLLVQPVRFEGDTCFPCCEAMGVSRRCAHRWMARRDVSIVTHLDGVLWR
jgi:hypothetical protein